jgi:molecular chaperone DnaK
MPSYVGIDLGTTYSAVSTLDEAGRPVIVANSEGANTTPSCVLVEGNQLIVGEDARRQWGTNPENVGARFKTQMGTETTYSLGGSQFTPTDLSAAVLKKLRLDTEEKLGEIAEAVVTIPANFSNEAREATLRAARDAGLKVKYIINEPTAAALFYAYKMGKTLHGKYAVYDFGGGTFDVSIIQVDGQQIEVLASHGVAKLGGDDFDRALQQIVAAKYQSKIGKKLNLDDYTKGRAEEDKKSLSKRDNINIRVAQQTVEVTKEEFESSISSFIAQAEMLCESAMEEAKASPETVEGVFLVGGTTRVPIVRQSVKRTFGKEPTSTVNVDEVVALGASIYAAHKSDQRHLSEPQKAAISAIHFSEVTNFCFGTLIANYDLTRNRPVLSNAVIIEKNTKIPCSVTRTFTTTRDGQTAVDCSVSQSIAAETDPRFVKMIWEGNLDLPPGRPAGQEIIVTYGFDANNLMSCRFKDAATGVERTINLSPHAKSDGGADIDRFLVE